MNDITERWLPVPGYEGYYEVSDLGSVRSVRHMTKVGPRGGKMLKPGPDKNGYLRLNLSRDGVVAPRVPVHLLVLLAFVGSCPPGQQVRHGVGGKLDNSLANLSYGTPLENSDDKRRDGTMACGERQGNARFTADIVTDMRRRHAAGESMTDIGFRYHAAQPVISRIVRGESWAHVPFPDSAHDAITSTMTSAPR